MKSSFSVILLVGALFVSAPVWATTFTASVERSQVSKDEAFTLILTADGQPAGNPDFSVLTTDFDIQATSETNQFDLSNGHASALTQWRLQLVAKRTGNLTIPAINFYDQKTTLLHITVTATPASNTARDTGGEAKKVFLEVSAEPNNTYVQSQILYAVRLYAINDIANNWQSAFLTPPSAPDTIIKQIGNFSHHNTTRNGHDYVVSEGYFALFPQHSGRLTIKPPLFKGDEVVPLSNELDAQDLNSQFFGTGLRPIQASATPITLDIKPQASNLAAGQQWLPAKNLSVQESWSSDPMQLKVGSPITRTITLDAVGLAAEQLPKLASATLQGVNAYPDQPVLVTGESANNITGKRIDKIAYVPTQAGKVIVPALSVSWWNTETDRLITTTLPAVTLQIAPAITATPAAVLPPTRNVAPTVTPLAATASPATLFWPVLALLFLVAWVITVLLWLHHRKQRGLLKKSELSEPSAVISMRASHSLIKKACDKNDVQQVKVALLNWAQSQWPQQQILSLGQVGDLIGEHALAAAIKRIDYLLYASGENTWHGNSFWQLYEDYLRQLKIKKKMQKDPLPALHL